MTMWISQFERTCRYFDRTKINKDNLRFTNCLYCGKRIAIYRLGWINSIIEEVENGEYNIHVCNEYINATPEKREEVRRISLLNKFGKINTPTKMKIIRKYGEFVKDLLE